MPRAAAQATGARGAPQPGGIDACSRGSSWLRRSRCESPLEPRAPGAPAPPDSPLLSLQNLSGWMGRTGPSCASPDEVRGRGEDVGVGEVGRTPLGETGQPAGDRGKGGRQLGFPPGQMAAQLHDLRTVEAAKKEFEEYVRQQVSLACWEPGRPAGEEPGIV